MTRDEFQQLIADGIVMLDGATGTNLQQAGLPVGVCPEAWILENRTAMIDLQRQFVVAGTQILYAPTFTGNRIKLGEYGLADRLAEMNRDLVALSKEAAAGKAFVAGDMTMTGRQLRPLGELHFEELVDVYKEQVVALADGGADLFVIETMMSLQETRAAVLAVKESCDLPVMATLTFENDGRTLFGTPPAAAVVTLQSLGVDAVGLNCSTGPDGMLPIVEEMYAYATVPIIAKPNAGLPALADGATVYTMTPGDFGAACCRLVAAGARIVGGCCGTTPEHIRVLAESVGTMEPLPVKKEKRRVISSERSVLDIRLDGPLQIVGERINPTGKKKLQEELRAGTFDLVRAMAREQEEKGAAVLDVNMGMNGIDEKATMLQAIDEITGVTNLPLCIDSSYPDVLAAALRRYPGRALLNSVSYETAKYEKLLPVIRKYGAMFILLPLSDDGIPATQDEKHRIIRALTSAAEAAGLAREDIVVDGLAATVGAAPRAALDCLDTFAYCRNSLGLATICGLSNISFGLPQRLFVNAAFLTMAAAGGLTLAIANPSQELLLQAAAAANLLMNHEGSDLAYIQRMEPYGSRTVSLQTAEKNGGTAVRAETDREEDNPVFEAVLKGEKGTIISLTKAELDKGKSAETIINKFLIPAINRVGELFDQQVYFLPQLIAGANTMEKAIHFLEPLLQGNVAEEKATIVIATVEGDVHDIGKNLVALMLRNYGYHVIDLGKDVPASRIIATAMAEHAAVVGLSALMTTTMMQMKAVIAKAAASGYNGKIIIGGAAVTPGFAVEIGADGYSKDAAECVKLVGTMLDR
ncbi:homocysteine S-methyltransferase family protein [Megasphaera vaginalis (ex Srinivasan et al. 2021)]|uniref:Methionine synthase n=1 Tax=Megasphaera vaginalis (ex Srinivasan et al. 2021) TaxID=1111454 RepID=U7US78_9FIRM|nr:homocysteine S-methyltransferase family protein [Megasphaera vaginalis (ex Srinivasan et al. 2021)]ERT61749.1 homocysteine S-methyltransferase [Megasphaera vaginalis (ex Srinivasan et al. 2021)]